MATGQDSDPRQGGAEPRPEPVENLIKPRNPAGAGAESPLVARKPAGNVKRPAGSAGGGGGGGSGGGGKAPWWAVGVLAGALVGGVFYLKRSMDDLEERLGGAPAPVVPGGGEAALEGEVRVLEARVAGLEKAISELKAACATSGDGAGGGDGDGVLERLEKRAKLARLADEAIAMGFRSVLRDIDAAVLDKTDEEMQRCANAELARVEIYYLNGAGFFPLPLPEEQDGVPPAEIGTDRLAEYLLVAESPAPLRARAAQLLARRTDMLAADALSEALVLEPDLRVLVHATASFRRVTGCPIASVFGGPDMRTWLVENRELVDARFKDIAERRANEVGG